MVPNAEFNCICSDPSTVAMTYDITAVSSRALVNKALAVEYRWQDNLLARLARTLLVGAPPRAVAMGQEHQDAVGYRRTGRPWDGLTD